MDKSREFRWVRFDAQTVSDAIEVFLSHLGFSLNDALKPLMRVEHDLHAWRYDTLDEFLAAYRSDFVNALVDYSVQPQTDEGKLDFSKERGEFEFHCYLQPKEVTYPYTVAKVKLPTVAQIESVLAVLENAAEGSRIQEAPWESRVTVFIGHGRSSLWKNLDSHLHHQHGYQTVAYEHGARAGHTIRDVLEGMLDQSSFAVLVMTGEDEDAAGQLHARENVIHEAGLFQGRLGFPKAVVLLEEGCAEFSNISGVNQIRFHKGNIRETFGDVLATIRREFT
jgi:predicted nucleotide-binding protein